MQQRRVDGRVEAVVDVLAQNQSDFLPAGMDGFDIKSCDATLLAMRRQGHASSKWRYVGVVDIKAALHL